MPHHTNDAICLKCEEKLEEVHPQLARWFREEVKNLYPDAHVSWGFRNKMDQDQCVADGKSTLPWPKSKHNHLEQGKPCAKALDLFKLVAGCATFPHDFYEAINLYNEAYALPIKWGGLFPHLVDADHFELSFTPLPAADERPPSQKSD